MTISDGALQLYLAGALEPEEATALAHRLKADKRLTQRFSRLQARAWDLPDPWQMPPTDTLLPARLAGASILGPAAVHPGEVCRILIQPPPDPQGREVVLLCRGPHEAWQVVSPLAPEERVIGLDQLDTEGGCLCVDFIARPPAGEQSWAVALPQRSLLDAFDFTLPDWRPLRAEVEAGRIPLTSLEICVEV